MTAADIARQLAGDILGVCRHLLPNGRDKAGEWCVGSLAGEEGESLKVRLTGPRAGVWSDFATGDAGDALDLWVRVNRISVSDAMREVAQYLGIKPVQMGRPKPLVKAPKESAKADADARVWAWLTQARKLPEASLRAYRVGAYKGAVALPAFTPDGKAIQYIKYREPGEKKFWSEKGGEPCLFGWQAIPPDAREVCLVEGEMDAIAMHAYGFPALSVTNGAGNLGWIESEFDHLARFDTIHLAFDMDDAGQAAAPKVAERLGLARCRLVSLPHKDANACLLSGAEGEEIDAAIRNARTFDPPELVSASSLVDAVIRLIHPEGPEIGVRMPWGKAQGKFLFRPGELTVLAGRNNTGKSQMVGQLTLAALSQGQRACVASLEFRPAMWMRRLTIQAAALREPTAPYIEAVHRWYEDKLWAFNATGTAKTDRVLEVFAYAAARYGVRWFVVDNLSKCGIGDDDYNAQKDLVDRLGDFARDTDGHVVLVHHVRKGEDDRNAVPTNSDVKGSGGIGDMADNVLLMWRNRRKEDQKDLADQAGEPFDGDDKPDAMLVVDKARNGDELPKIGLWYAKACYQYLEGPRRSPRQFVQWSAIQEGVA